MNRDKASVSGVSNWGGCIACCCGEHASSRTMSLSALDNLLSKCRANALAQQTF